MAKTDNVRQVDLPRATGGGPVYIRGGGAGGVSNADTVDGYHASSTPTAGKLLALDASAQFNPSVIEWADVAGAGLSASGDTLVVQWGTTPTTIQPDDAAAGGSAATSARSDHRHAIATAVPGTILPDDSANEGSATSFARSDHRHAIAAGAPGSISPDDAAAEGTATTFARSDHRHAITAAAPAANLSASTSNAEGSASSFSRSDHSHAITAYSDASVYPGHLLKGDASGDLKVRRLEASDRLIASLLTSVVGTGLTVQPDGDLILDPDSNLAKVSSGVRLQSDGYVSQTTGWGVAYNGAADFRYLYVDEMHAKAFVADLEQALAGGQIIAKSVAPLQSDFTVPAPGATADLWVESFAGFPAAQVFQNGDTVMVRTFSRTGTSLTIGNAFGTVSGAFIVSGEGRQRWTFTRLSGTVNGHPRGGYMAAGTVVPRGTLALDFGVSGNGYYEVSAIDGAMGANSPYAQIVTWNAHPWYDRTVRSRYGNLYGVFASAGEYGMFAGDGAANADKFLRLSNNAIEGHNLPIRLYDGATQVVRLEPGTYPYLGIGSPAPTSYLGATGIWMGKHTSAYKAHVGTVSGGDVTAGWKWDGTTLTVRGQIYVTGGDAAKTDLSNVAANTVTGKVNADSTLIQPGRILISGATTLDGWRYGNSTMIDGGDIYAGSVTAAQMSVTGFNLVDNPGFEHWSSTTAANGWVLHADAVRTSSTVHSGTYCLAVPGTGAAKSVARQDIPVTAGASYYLEGWVYLSSPASGITRNVRWGAVELDAAGMIIAGTYHNPTEGNTIPRGVWTKQSVLFTTASNCAYVRVYLYAGADLVAGEYARGDDVSLRAASGMNLLVGTPGSARVEINNAGIEGYSDANTKQFYIRTSDGRAMFGGGHGVLDASGLSLDGTSGTSGAGAIAWRTVTDPAPGGSLVAYLSSSTSGFNSYSRWDTNLHQHFSEGTTQIVAYGNSVDRYSILALRSTASDTGGTAYMGVYSQLQAKALMSMDAATPRVYFATGGVDRVTISNTALTSSVAISASAGGTFSNSNENCLAISRAAGNTRGLRWYSGTSLRWQIGVDNVAESGSNVGSDFAFWAYNDSGSFIAKVAAIARSTGNAWFVGNVSAASFTDRTPYPDKATALAAVRSMRQAKRPTGGLDHEALHEYVRSNGNEPGRNLSATVSAQNVVIQELLDRIERLEKGVRA